MKTDNYLTLCLEQAAKSPLHYRHGAIVVRGGKVIGQGYNDYRPSFNGGALKHGRIAHSPLDRDAVKELKCKLKKKKEQQQEDRKQNCPPTTSTFTPFEVPKSTGGGHSVNQPLSMHSEMMAIHSALSASSTLSSTTFSRENPCFKLRSNDKRKARLQREALLAYVAAVCETSPTSGKAQVHRELAPNNGKRGDHNYNKKDKDDEDAYTLAPLFKDAGVAFHSTQSGDKHHQDQKRRKNLNCGQNEKSPKRQYRREYCQYYRYGSQTQHPCGQPQAEPLLSKSGRILGAGNVALLYDSTISTDDDHDEDEKMAGKTTFDSVASSCNHKRKKHYNPYGKMRVDKSQDEVGKHLLLPTGRAGDRTASVNDRRKHPRLQGADVYVTRLGCSSKAEKGPMKITASEAPLELPADDAFAFSTESLSLPGTSSPSGAGSLHDELVNREPTPSPSMKATAHNRSVDRSTVSASRPCYRCIAFMHSVGIRRVFWTNDSGEWESGKVAQLAEYMVNSSGADRGPTGNGLFVTKHEVLMLRRMIGQN